MLNKTKELGDCRGCAKILIYSNNKSRIKEVQEKGGWDLNIDNWPLRAPDELQRSFVRSFFACVNVFMPRRDTGRAARRSQQRQT